jgi:heme exporter protein D
MNFAFETLQDFLNMGGYGFYVWLAYGLTFAVLVTLCIHSCFLQTKYIKQIIKQTHRKNTLAKKKRVLD